MNDLRRKRNMNGKKKAVIIPVKNGEKMVGEFGQ
ncbi:hypothetical protein C5S39_14355 [Candidatus Methanophagaceae archaeon]|nr:hypothetical protein C5S39_14355 [Methanophagales archaeon]